MTPKIRPSQKKNEKIAKQAIEKSRSNTKDVKALSKEIQRKTRENLDNKLTALGVSKPKTLTVSGVSKAKTVAEEGIFSKAGNAIVDGAKSIGKTILFIK